VAKPMPQNGDPDKKTKVFEFIIQALGDHEKEMDRLANRLETTKEDFSAATQKLDKRLDKMTQQVDYIQAQIQQLRKQWL
jgi:predicted  nucleic acid-binding Zn-ribbon protein